MYLKPRTCTATAAAVNSSARTPWNATRFKEASEPKRRADAIPSNKYLWQELTHTPQPDTRSIRTPTRTPLRVAARAQDT